MKFEPHRTFRYYRIKFLRLKGDPDYLARGVAVGIFIGITPTIPLHTILILALAFILNTSKVSSILSSFLVSNPLTFFIQYYFSWLIGNALFPGKLTWEKISTVMISISSEAGFTTIIKQLLALGYEALIVMLIGGCLLALPFSITGYFLSLKLFSAIQEKRQLRLERKGNDAVEK